MICSAVFLAVVEKPAKGQDCPSTRHHIQQEDQRPYWQHVNFDCRLYRNDHSLLILHRTGSAKKTARQSIQKYNTPDNTGVMRCCLACYQACTGEDLPERPLPHFICHIACRCVSRLSMGPNVLCLANSHSSHDPTRLRRRAAIHEQKRKLRRKAH